MECCGGGRETIWIVGVARGQFGHKTGYKPWRLSVDGEEALNAQQGWYDDVWRVRWK